ncbi:4'-phosphopantetheinyl transferase superfamily protein [Achromobacter seleniivolatilans]|uniref:4'-phosphopantetheinyl transferase superfamily protein n=1 Tax=Achromobacter seleniivolatilans TaxID=3047478 RepID=A0ABY9M8G9_9BURK|nr:4'-phosphopantetheinyl transferase superfamily protein [Achromobacter sp. R39]WMD22879.1 4'-phosphopantetheinyl transferase superfamily protein [Achromobacter sp. R39]
MYWADQSAASHYRAHDLSAEDAQRALAIRSRKAQADWQVSRALLHDIRQFFPAPGALSLSHSAGHAICARAPAGFAVGADVERIRPRDVLRMAEWVCSKVEQHTLSGLSGAAQLEHFYLLWTLKESFIKAAKLDFPADMASVGLAARAGGGWALCAPAGVWRACSWRIGDDWMASVAWQASSLAPAPPQWRAGAGSVLPPIELIGDWRSLAG